MSFPNFLSTEESDFSADDEIMDPDFSLNTHSKKRKHDDRGSMLVKKSKLFEEKILFNNEYYRDLKHVTDETSQVVTTSAKCSTCSLIIKVTGWVTSNFVTHLRRKHPDVFKEYESSKPKTRNRAINKQKRFDELVLSFIIDTSSPVSIVEKESFKSLFKGTGLKVMSRKVAMAKLDSKYNDMMLRLKSKMSKIHNFCTTADIWSTNHRSFLGYTCHWLDNNFQRKSVALACRRFSGIHSADRIAPLITEVNNDFNLDHSNVVATVTGNGSNFVKAFKEYGVQPMVVSADGDVADDTDVEEDLAQFHEVTTYLPKHERCASHTLNLLASTDFNKILQANKELYQRHSQDLTPPTGATPPHQLSVTWATNCDFNEEGVKLRPMHSNSEEASVPTVTERERRSTLQDEKLNELSVGLDSPVNGIIDYQQHQRQSDEENYNYNDEDEEDDYSISVSAIMQRRASVRGYRNKRGSRSSRRTSSPMDHVLDNAERRRSSVYTTSSDEGTNQESTQEQIFENIRLHKEVIQSVKLQPWHIRKKLKLVRQAKTYVARHEGALQERFAMSRSTRDLWARFKILMAARWRHWKRETASFLTVLIPWELRIKEIESHFGSGVASYFTFLRWLMWVNIMIAIPLVAFVIGPEYFATKHDETDPRKKMTDHEFKVAGNLFTIWEFEGYLKYSPMFYGYYSSLSGASSLGYKLPLAYFLTAVVVYIYSFVATLRKMAENSRNSKLSSKDDECTFSWKLFTGWDFMIGHAETAHNRIASVVVGFKEALLEEAEKKKDNRNWRIILQRILVNILVMGLLAASGYTVVALVNNAENLALQDNWLSRNAVNVTMTLLSFFLPMIFEALGLFENWHPRQQLRLQLARIMILNMLNLYSLMFSFIYKINSKEKPLQKLKIYNETATLEYAQLTTIIESIKTATTTLVYQDVYSTAADEISTTSSGSTISDTSTTEFLLGTTASAIYSTVSRMKCYNITIKCSKPTRIGQRSLATTTALLLLNLTTTILPSTTIEPTTNEPVTTMWTTGEPSTITTTTIATTKPTTAYNILTTYADTTTVTTTSTTDLTTSTSSSTTIEDFKTSDTIENDDYTSSPDMDSTTTWQSSTTTTPSPGNDSFFDYYDYFVGLPIDMESSEDIATENADDDEQDKTAKDKLQQLVRHSRAAADELSEDGMAPVKKPPRKSKYSRRKSDSQVIKENTENEEDDNETSTTGTRSTSMTTLLATNPPTTTVATTTDETTGATTTSTPTSSDSPQNQSSWWQRNKNLLNVVAYFTTTTTTNEPPTATMMTKEAIPKIPTIASSSSAAATTIRSDTLEERTPYFISDDDIADIGETMFIDANELDDDNMENCTRMICEPADMFTSTTEMDATTLFNTELPTPLLTPLELHQKRLAEVKQTLKMIQRNLTSMCWETSLGQELSKVIVFDGIMSIVAPLCIDFLRALFVRYVNQNWCWDMEKTFPQYGDFKIAENILTLINNQGQVWMGIFFSPGLVIINLVKLMIMMYFRSWIVLTCNVPHEVVFKASKSNNFYLSLLLTMLFLCVLPVGYAIVWLRPSWHCGPFSDYKRISEFITNTTRNALPTQLHEPLDYMTSSSTVIPLLLLLILIIYYLVSLTGALREANQDLRTQLQKEREEERKKIFKVPEVKPAEPSATTFTNRWRKVLEASSPVTPTQAPDFETDEYKNQARKELISRIMKKALRKGSATSDDESVVIRQGRDDDDTDTEHHDSLPHDEEAKDKRFGLSKLQQIRRIRKPSLVDIVNIAKTERERAAAAAAAAMPASNKTERERTAAAAAAATSMPAAKEIHPKGRFKIERQEKKDAGSRKTPPATSPKTPPTTATDHDPDVNSRIVNERRVSLLNRKKEDDGNDDAGEKKSLEQKPVPLKKQPKHVDQRAPLRKVLPPTHSDSNFEVIDEKKPPPPPSEHLTEFKFKLRRPRMKDTKSTTNATTEPEVFKFDEKAVQRSQNKQLGLPFDSPTMPSTPHSSAESPATAKSRDDSNPTTPTSISSLKHQNVEKLANLSRQGRKKIGSLLALVREAVNTKRSDSDSPPSEEADSNTTAIQIPQTPEPQTNKTQIAPLDIKLATAAKQVKKPPTTPKLAPIEHPEELDQLGSINFPKRSLSQRRKPQIEGSKSMGQDAKTSVPWSDNIPTITISHTGSDECIGEAEPAAIPTTPTTPGSVVNIIKIQIEDEKPAKT